MSDTSTLCQCGEPATATYSRARIRVCPLCKIRLTLAALKRANRGRVPFAEGRRQLGAAFDAGRQSVRTQR